MQSNRKRLLKKSVRYAVDFRISSFLRSHTRTFLPMYWSESIETRSNFGDQLNKQFAKKIFGREPVNIKQTFGFSSSYPPLYLIGSILDGMYSKPGIICGAGFKYHDGIFFSKPSRVISVRGPLSAKLFARHDISVPSFSLDPGFLTSHFWPSSGKNIKREVGIVLHYKDKNLESFFRHRGLEVIDVQSPISEVLEFIEHSKIIASSSLHGLIVAASYQKKILWFNGNSLLAGGKFKFFDAFEAVNIDIVQHDFFSLSENYIVDRSISVDLTNFTSYWIQNILPELENVYE